MKSSQEEARELAQLHYQVEEGITKIYHILDKEESPSQPKETIKLLEVNENTVPSGIFPLWFGAAPTLGIHYPSVIVEVTPDEYQKIANQQLELPQGWAVGQLIPKRDGHGEA